MNSKLQWMVVNTCRLVVSATFVFSGLVKLIDPQGTAYKIHDYLVALHLSDVFSFQYLPLTLSVALGTTEFCLGIALSFSIRRRLTLGLMLALTAFYTPLTLWLAITDAVSDCGCFGDALHLTNWQTFGKNVVLLLLLAYLWLRRDRLTRLVSEGAQWLVSLFNILYALFLAGICLYGEPIIDFRPYHIGQHIPTAMEWPEDPAQLPEILDFDFEGYAHEGDSIIPLTAETVLADTSYTFLLTAPHLEQADDSNMERINALYDYAHSHGYRFLCLTASGDSAIHRWQDLTGAEYPFAFMDELALKTMARSNPGVLLLHDGVITAKWSHNLLPGEEELTTSLDAAPWAHPRIETYRHMLLLLLLWYLLPLGLLIVMDRTYASIRWWRRKKAMQTASTS
ncbi:MAG: DoxX family membrane protein [Bacteroidaceae bacterium]|nr:DoxX family membrane protein [Bacteroidaceae bacterium]